MTSSPKPNQHYRLSLEKAIQDYKDGIITATGLVYYAVGIYRAPGQKLRVKEIDAFCLELGINRATFYRAISKLKAKGRIEWEAIAGIDLWIPLSNVVEIQSGQEVSQDCEIQLQDCETQSQDCEIQLQDCETQSQLSDNQSLELAHSKGLGQSSNILSNSYQLYINSLSENERKSFLEFGQKKANKLPKPPELPLRWIEVNWDELRVQWEKTTGKISVEEAHKWESHPQKEEWLDKIRELGFGGFLVENPKEEKLRREFYQWANAENLIWEKNDAI